MTALALDDLSPLDLGAAVLVLDARLFPAAGNGVVHDGGSGDGDTGENRMGIDQGIGFDIGFSMSTFSDSPWRVTALVASE